MAFVGVGSSHHDLSETSLSHQSCLD